jgi:hypothetical protein
LCSGSMGVSCSGISLCGIGLGSTCRARPGRTLAVRSWKRISKFSKVFVIDSLNQEDL